LGASEERARARREGRFAGNCGPWLFGSVRHGCPVWHFAKSGRVAGSGFLVRWLSGLVAPSGCLSVCATRFFWLRSGSVLRWFVQPAGVPTCVAQAGAALPPRAAFKTVWPERCNRQNPGCWILARWPVGKPSALVVSGSKKHPFAPRRFSAMVSIRSVTVCSSPPGPQAGVVQAGF